MAPGGMETDVNPFPLGTRHTLQSAGLVRELGRGIKRCPRAEESLALRTERALASPEEEDLRVGTGQGGHTTAQPMCFSNA